MTQAHSTVCNLFLAGAFVQIAGLISVAPAAAAPLATADVSTRRLLNALDERQMPDVALWVLSRIESDPEASADLKKDIPYRRAAALVATTRTESDSKKRVQIFEKAEAELDRFLQENDGGEQAIAAYKQKGSMLVERGRAKVEQAKHPGEDVKKLHAEAIAFFENSVKSFEGAETAALAALKIVDAEVGAFREKEQKEKDAKAENASDDAKSKKGTSPPKKSTRSSADEAALVLLEEKQDSLRGELLGTRLLIATVLFEESKALEKDSKEWKKAIVDSTAKFAQLFEKYPTRGVGLYARYYEGRNYVVLGDRPKALLTLSNIRLLEGEAGLVPSLRAKAINSSLECWLEDKKYDEFDEKLLKHAMATMPTKLDADWLGMKYRAAVLLELRAIAIPDADKTKRIPLQKDAKKLALEVAKANKDFGKEARELLAKLGNQLPDDAGTDISFKAAMDEARVLLTSMQAKRAEVKIAEAAGKSEDAKVASEEAAASRTKTVEAIRKAMPLADDTDLEMLNQARYLLTFLMYDAKQLQAAAAMGGFLAERYPNAKGSRQAAKIAMASWQQLQKQEEKSWRENAKTQCAQLADIIMSTWPDDSESADAAIVAMQAAADSKGIDKILAIMAKVPEKSPRRVEVLLRGGGAIWREVLESKRLERERPAAKNKQLADWKAKATQAIDDGLALVPQGSPPSAVAVAAALARCQIASDDGDDSLLAKILEHSVYGPWTVASGKDAAVLGGPLMEQTLSVALRYFIQSEQLPKAQQAMDKLEEAAGKGEEASAKLTGMYLSMGHDLQAQLKDLGKGDGEDAETTAKATAILGGFEKFLDGVAKRDAKLTSQIWVATTYLMLGSGQETGAIVPKARAIQYLARAADVYAGMLKKGGAEIAKFEPSIRLRMASISREREKWDEAQGHLDWYLADVKRQNSIEAQVLSAELMQIAGLTIAAGTADKVKADEYFKQAIVGRKTGTSVVWGWGGLANKLSRQTGAGNDEKTVKLRNQFFTARLNIGICRFQRAQLAKGSENGKKLLGMALNDVILTYKLYPELGGDVFRQQFDKLLKEIQAAQGVASPGGLADVDKATAATAAAAATGNGT